MRRWFISYHSPDQALAERLKAAIEHKDSASRVFFAPTHLRAGRSWSRQLADEIAQANAFILLIGEKGVGDWQELEYDEALDRWTTSQSKSPNFPLIVVLLEGQTAPGLQFLRRMHWIITRDLGSEKDIGRIFDAAAGRSTNLGELWRYTSPYRGLEAMEEKDSDYFFGRKRETVEVLSALAAPDRLPVLIGNSGVGKSSLAKAGALSALKRQAWPEQATGANEWPGVFKDSRQWCFLSLKPGTEPLKALVDSFLDVWQFETEYERVREQKGWIELLLGKGTLSDLIEATERCRAKLDQPKPPAFMLYVDQGEELYVRSEEQQRRRFSELLAQALPDPRLRTMMSLRADFLGYLQSDKPLFKARQHIDVTPLGEEELREVVSRPAQLLGAQFESDGLVATITRRAAEESVKDVGALPLLSYTLDDMWTQMMRRGDGRLRLPAESFELGGVLVNRASNFLAKRPGAEDALRRILTLKLATVREDGEPTRRRAPRSEFSDDEWRLVSELADYPNRLLVTATPEGGETYAEVAHETIFGRWDKLREWIAAEREFLAWRSGLEAARGAWRAAPKPAKDSALLMGLALAKAQNWLAKRAEDLPELDREFIRQSIEREKGARGRARRVQALVYLLLVGVIGGLIGWVNQEYIKGEMNWVLTMRPYKVANVDSYVLKPDAERALRPTDTFRECAKNCPEMVVIRAGQFMMGSPPGENGRSEDEGQQRLVRIVQPFAVSKFAVTFADWDACVSVGGCLREGRAEDSGWGRDTRPVIYVSWDDAQQYAAWLSRMTGKPYRLLTEAEYEYATRAETTTPYPWGDDIGKNNANCNGCDSQWDNRQTAPVGSFTPNAFGLYDMVGNVFAWVEDCYHPRYEDAPTDGSALISGECSKRVLRGGAWNFAPELLRSAARGRYSKDMRDLDIGFRVGRTLTPRTGAASSWLNQIEIWFSVLSRGARRALGAIAATFLPYRL
jgi:formylglycine-generating enzyme required for sulfatase activity